MVLPPGSAAFFLGEALREKKTLPGQADGGLQCPVLDQSLSPRAPPPGRSRDKRQEGRKGASIRDRRAWVRSRRDGRGRGLRLPEARQVGLELPDPALPPEGGRNPGEKPDENTDPEGSDDDHKDGGVSGIVQEPDRNDTRVLDREHRDDPQKDDKNDQDHSHGGGLYHTESMQPTRKVTDAATDPFREPGDSGFRREPARNGPSRGTRFRTGRCGSPRGRCPAPGKAPSRGGPPPGGRPPGGTGGRRRRGSPRASPRRSGACAVCDSRPRGAGGCR